MEVDERLLDGDLDDSVDLDHSPQDKLNISRLSRKVNEKIRRDRLNNLIAQLAEEVPTIKYAHRRLDKSSVLRLTVSFLKLHHGLRQKRFASESIYNDRSLYNKVNMVSDGMLMVMTQSGLILYVSPLVKKTLGYHESDVIGFDISRFVHPDDVSCFMCQSEEDSSKEAAFASFKNENEFTQPHKVQIHGRHKTTFYARMMKILRPIKKKGEVELVEEDPYELMQVKTFFERQEDDKQRDELWMIAYIKPFVQESIKELSIGIAEFQKNNEWATLHGLDSKIHAVEHRASLFHGFLASEVIGKTPYFLVWEEDLEYVCRSHQLIIIDEEIPSTVFRMKTVVGKPLYVQSRSIIIKDKWTKQPKCIVSVNEVLSEEDGEKMLVIQKKRVYELTKTTKQLSIQETDEERDEGETNSQCSSDMQQGSSDCRQSDSDNDWSLHSSDFKSEPCSPKQLFSQKRDIIAQHRCTGKSLGELYEERALSYYEQVQKSSSSASSVTSEGSSFSIKRSHDSIDSDNGIPSMHCDCEAINAKDSNPRIIVNSRTSQAKVECKKVQSAYENPDENQDFHRHLEPFCTHSSNFTEVNKCSANVKSLSDESESTSTPVLKKLLENKNSVKVQKAKIIKDINTGNHRGSQSSKTEHQTSSSSSTPSKTLNKITTKPILKGILEGSLTFVGQSKYELSNSDNACDNRISFTDTDSRQCSHLASYSSSMLDYDESLPAISPFSGGEHSDHAHNSAGASGDIGPIQSPTIGSMTMSGSEDMRNDQSKVFTHFTRQLMLKYGQIKDTFSSHQLTIRALREHLEQPETVKLMNQQQREMHIQLINRLKCAENQLGIQDQLLAELEVELATEKISA